MLAKAFAGELAASRGEGASMSKKKDKKKDKKKKKK